MLNKRFLCITFVSSANSSLVGILITIGDVTDIFAIASQATLLGLVLTQKRRKQRSANETRWNTGGSRDIKFGATNPLKENFLCNCFMRLGFIFTHYSSQTNYASVLCDI